MNKSQETMVFSGRQKFLSIFCLKTREFEIKKLIFVKSGVDKEYLENYNKNALSVGQIIAVVCR